MPQTPNLGLQSYIDQYQGQQDKANAANQGRYKHLLGVARKGGSGDRKLIRRDFADNWGNAQQSAIGRGLFNTSFLDSARNRNLESQDVALNQSRQNQRGEVMGIMERRTDQQPNASLLTSLLQGAAQGFGQQQGQNSGGRGYSFGGINMPTQPLTGDSIFGNMGGGGGGGGPGGGNSPVDFGGTGGGGGGAGPASDGRNHGIGFNPGRGDRVVGAGPGGMVLDPISGTYRQPGPWQTYGGRR